MKTQLLCTRIPASGVPMRINKLGIEFEIYFLVCFTVFDISIFSFSISFF